MTTKLDALQRWVDKIAARTKPANIHWCTGTDEEYQQLIDLMISDGTLSRLNEEHFPNCYLHLSDPSDVARVEHLTYVCTRDPGDAGPNNLWMAPREAHRKVDVLFDGYW